MDLTLTDLLGEDSELMEIVLALDCCVGGGGGGGVLVISFETFKLDFGGLFFSFPDFLGEDCLVSLVVVDFFTGDFDLETATIGFCCFLGELGACLLGSIGFLLLLLRLMSGEAEALTFAGTASVSSYPLSLVDASASELSSPFGSKRLLLLSLFFFFVGLFDLLLVGLSSLVTLSLLAAGFFHIETIVSLTESLTISSLSFVSSSSSSSKISLNQIKTAVQIRHFH